MTLKDKGPVVVGWLMGGSSTPGFVTSIAALTAVSPQLGVDLLGAIPKVSGPRIAASRNSLFEHFLATPGEWFFMLDDDMSFEPDVLARLLQVADAEQRPIVGGYAYAAGRDGYFSTLWAAGENGRPTRVDEAPEGKILKTIATGAACVLVHRSVIEKIKEARAGEAWIWFQETSWQGHSVGEDFTFCVRAGEQGFPIHVDTGAEFGHEKLVTIDREFVSTWRAAHRVILTGAPRSGLGFISAVLTQSGIPSTHNSVFDGKGWQWQRVEASWKAAAHLGELNEAGVLLGAKTPHIVHVVRHPLAVVQSILKHGLVSECEFGFPLPSNEREAAMEIYLEMNEMIEPWAQQFIRIEELSEEDLATIAHEAGGHHNLADMILPMSTVHPDIAPLELEWKDLPAGDRRERLQIMGKDYGYEL
jgi:Glycosyltransferase like family 2